MQILKLPAIIIFMQLLVACSNSPGPLAGTWRLAGFMPMTIQFRDGETEAVGIIEKVSYEVRGNDVLVTYKDGLMKGTSMRYTIVASGTARTELGTLSRIK